MEDKSAGSPRLSPAHIWLADVRLYVSEQYHIKWSLSDTDALKQLPYCADATEAVMAYLRTMLREGQSPVKSRGLSTVYEEPSASQLVIKQQLPSAMSMDVGSDAAT